MKLSTDPSSSRAPVYRTYFDGVSPASARRILLYIGIAALLVECLARVIPVTHSRTPASSLHGIRWLFQEMLLDKGPKIVAVGDSALVGGGVHDDEKTFMGQLGLAEGDHARVFNLGVPGGENGTSLLLLDALANKRAGGVERAIIQILPGKFFVGVPGGSGPPADAVDELRRFVPFIDPQKFGIATPVRTKPEQVEAVLQYDLGLVSAAYRDRDNLRIEELGGYPSFWAIGHLLPQRLRAAMLSQRGRGLNRLGAHMDDSPFEVSQRERGSAPYFAEQPQGAYLLEAIAAARRLTGRPPILIEFPMHYDYSILEPAELAQTFSALDRLDEYLQATATQTGSTLLRIDSKTFQDPGLWTRTAAHPSADGHKEIWKRLGPTLVHSLE